MTFGLAWSDFVDISLADPYIGEVFSASCGRPEYGIAYLNATDKTPATYTLGELAGPRDDPEPVALKLAGGRGALTVMVNGVPLPHRRGRHTLFFRPDGPGFVRLTIMDARGLSDSVMVRLQ